MRRSLSLLLLGAGVALLAAPPGAFARGGGAFHAAAGPAPAARVAPPVNHGGRGINHRILGSIHAGYHLGFGYLGFRATAHRRGRGRSDYGYGYGGNWSGGLCCYALPYDYDGYDQAAAAGGPPPPYIIFAGGPPLPRALPPMHMTVEHVDGVTIVRGPPILP